MRDVEFFGHESVASLKEYVSSGLDFVGGGAAHPRDDVGLHVVSVDSEEGGSLGCRGRRQADDEVESDAE